MLRKKKEKNIILVKLSSSSTKFIKEIVMPELNINMPLTENTISDIEDWIYDLEDSQYDEKGNKVNLDEFTKEKLLKAQKLLEELMIIWGGDNTIIDLNYLNNELNLK